MAQGAFDCSSNVIATIRIERFLYIRMRRCLLLHDFILGLCLRVISSPKMKIHFCQNDHNEELFHADNYKTTHRLENISFT